jgi:hypothetical protein
MNSRDRNGLYGGGNIMPCGSDRKCNSRSSGINTTLAVDSSGSDLIVASRPKKARSAYARMRYAKLVSMLVICAAATIVVSAIAHASVDTEKAAAPPAAPGPPYLLWGFTLDTGSNPVGCTITITNLRTLESNTTIVSDPSDGYYECDLQNGLPSAYQDGDLINVTAVAGTSIGWNELAVPGGPTMHMDVTLTGTVVIPELSMVIIPVMGMLAVFAVVRLKRRGEEQ